jgi:hypothetical protein
MRLGELLAIARECKGARPQGQDMRREIWILLMLVCWVFGLCTGFILGFARTCLP